MRTAFTPCVGPTGGALLVLVALAATLSPANGAAPGLVATGACRDGVPNGAYEIRGPEGQVRVNGAFARGRRTGTFLFWSPAGARVALVPYEDDVRAGTLALWYAAPDARAEPRRRLEATYVGGVLEGVARSWHANGNPRSERFYEHGVLTGARGWAEAGAPLPDAEARATAARDADADAALLAPLERLVAETRPPCATNGR